MLTIISALLGFFSSMTPDLLGVFKDKSDKKHELEIIKLQIEQQQKGHVQRLEEINIEADIAESKAIYKTFKSGIYWVDGLNASVRPVLAYAFFILYASIKCTEIIIYDATIADVWLQEDQAIFAAIISFYFGQRAFSKMRKQS